MRDSCGKRLTFGLALGLENAVELWRRGHGAGAVEMARTVYKALAPLGEAVLAQVEKHPPRNLHDAETLFGLGMEQRWKRATKEASRPHIASAMDAGAQVQLSLLTRCTVAEAKRFLAPGIAPWDGKARPPAKVPAKVRMGITQALHETMRQGYWSDMAWKVRDRLRRAIGKALRAGGKGRQVYKAVRGVLGRSATAARSWLIAVTETTGALNAGAHAARMARAESAPQGSRTSKEWATKRDARVRDAHEEADGQVVPVGGLFTVGGERCRYPGDITLSAANRCRCRCVAVALEDAATEAAWENEGPWAGPFRPRPFKERGRRGT